MFVTVTMQIKIQKVLYSYKLQHLNIKLCTHHPNMKSSARSEALLSNLLFDNGSYQLDTRVIPITPF